MRFIRSHGRFDGFYIILNGRYITFQLAYVRSLTTNHCHEILKQCSFRDRQPSLNLETDRLRLLCKMCNFFFYFLLKLIELLACWVIHALCFHPLFSFSLLMHRSTSFLAARLNDVVVYELAVVEAVSGPQLQCRNQPIFSKSSYIGLVNWPSAIF